MFRMNQNFLLYKPNYYFDLDWIDNLSQNNFISKKPVSMPATDGLCWTKRSYFVYKANSTIHLINLFSEN